jgi:hypothetical protein
MEKLLKDTFRLQGIVRAIKVLQFVSNCRLGVTAAEVAEYLKGVGDPVCERTAKRFCDVLVSLQLIRLTVRKNGGHSYSRGSFRVEFTGGFEDGEESEDSRDRVAMVSEGDHSA